MAHVRLVTLSRWLLVSYGVVAVLVLGFPGTSSATPGGVLLLLAPAFAIAGTVLAVHSQPTALGSPWLLLAGASVAALASQIAGSVSPSPGTPAAEAQALFFLTSIVLFATAVAWKLHQRDRERGLEIFLDSVLLVATATLVTLRWSPGAREVISGVLVLETGGTIAVVGTPIAAGCAFLFAAVLAAVQTGGRAGRVALAFAVTAAALSVASAPISLGYEACCQPGDSLALAFALGWTGVAMAGVVTAQTPPSELVTAIGDAGGRRLRLVVAPAVALVMGAVVVDAAWRPPLLEYTAITLGVVGVLLALRVSQLLHATQQLSAERVELAQTKMLVDVGQALAGTTDLQTTLQVVTGWARRMLHARAAAIELIDESGDHLEFRSIDGLPLDVMQLKFPIEGSFTGWVVKHGRPRTTGSARAEPEISRDVVHIFGKSPVAAAPLRYQGETLGALSCIGEYPFTGRDLELLGALADQAAVAIENARLFAQVHTLSVTDPLTGLPNRRQLVRDLAREFAAARRGRRLVAIMFDLNGFKEYNDRYGHLAGDEALKLFAAALATETRAMNLAARYGGDEFLALLADADRLGAEIFIDRVSQRFPGPDATPQQHVLSVAAGLAEYTPDMHTPDELVAAADRALYEVKSARKKLRV